MNLTYNMPVRIRFGIGELDHIGQESQTLGTRALLVTGRTAMRRMGILDRVMTLLEQSGVEVILYDKVESNPSVETVDKGAESYAEGCDLIIAMGGGSALDTAKGIGVVASHGGSIWDYIGTDKAAKPIPPILAIPTTAGTGSEVTPFSVFTNHSLQRKEALRSVLTYPKAAIIDPELTVGLSPYLTADTGMDALCHAIEAYISKKANAISDAYAEKAIALLSGNLRKAVWSGWDLDARASVSLGAVIAGLAISQAGTTASHGLAMAPGSKYNSEHGTTVGLLLPWVMEYSMPVCHDKFVEIARLMGEKTEGLSKYDAAAKAVGAVRRLITDIKLPSTLEYFGVTDADIENMVQDSLTQGASANNPRPLTYEGAREIYRSALR